MSARKPSHRHLKAGWVYCPYVGSAGGWQLSRAGEPMRVVCRAGKRWQAFLVRVIDGATLHSSPHTTRDAAMLQLEGMAT